MFELRDFIFYYWRSQEKAMKIVPNLHFSDPLICSLDSLERICTNLRKNGAEYVPFNYLVMAAYPDAVPIMEKQWRKEYMKGFVAGGKEKEEQNV